MAYKCRPWENYHVTGNIYGIAVNRRCECGAVKAEGYWLRYLDEKGYQATVSNFELMMTGNKLFNTEEEVLNYVISNKKRGNYPTIRIFGIYNTATKETEWLEWF